MAAVTQRYVYMAEHVEEEYFSDRGLALKIPKGATIVDVGAHFGLFTMSCFAKSGFTSRHFCFEPVPKIRAVCHATMAGLDPDRLKLKVFPYGLSDREGQVEFTYVAACPELSGYKDVDFERDVNLATATQIDRYYDPDCPEYFRKAMPSMFMYLPRFIGAPLLGLLYDMVMASRPATELVQCELRRLSDVLAVRGSTCRSPVEPHLCLPRGNPLAWLPWHLQPCSAHHRPSTTGRTVTVWLTRSRSLRSPSLPRRARRSARPSTC